MIILIFAPYWESAFMPEQEHHIAKPVGKEAQTAFNALVLRHKAMLWHVCSDYHLGKEWSMEDRMQEVMISLWRSFDQFEGRSSERTWVWRVATNTMLMLRRKAERQPATEPIEADLASEAIADPSDNGLAQLRQLIDTLPEKDGIFVRAFLDGFSYKEIADMNNTSIGAVAMRIARAKQRLRQLYEHETQTKE